MEPRAFKPLKMDMFGTGPRALKPLKTDMFGTTGPQALSNGHVGNHASSSPLKWTCLEPRARKPLKTDMFGTTGRPQQSTHSQRAVNAQSTHSQRDSQRLGSPVKHKENDQFGLGFKNNYIYKEIFGCGAAASKEFAFCGFFPKKSAR